jgi:Domain of unknown function (DUF4129)
MILGTQKFVLSVLFTLFGLQSVLLATTLNTYRQKIQKVNESVSVLEYPEENLSEAQNIAQQREILQVIRAKLPLTQKVELTGTTIEVNHGWILEKLKEFENESYNSDKRELITSELSEHLSALVSKLTELENQEVGKRTKDEEKQKLDEILKRAEYQKTVEEETWLQRKWREFWEWIWQVTPRPERQRQEAAGSPLISTTLLYIIVAVALVLIGFLIYRFGPFLAKRFRERERKEKKSRLILGETIAADETSQIIFSEAENLAREGNLRGAIRKGYIALLCELSDRKLIGLARHKTNRDYLRDVQKRKNLHQNMNELTNNFERNWYGLQKTDERDWDEFKQNYQQAVSGKG